MKTFLLFRHGLSTHSLHGYGDKILTAELLPEGIPPIQRMAEFLKEMPTDVNFVSPVLRCQQTAKIIEQGSGKVFMTDDRLSEYQARESTEEFTELRERCQDFLTEVQAMSAANILICSHGAVI